MSSIDTLISYIYIYIYNAFYIKTENCTLFSNIDLISYCTNTEIGDLDNELSTLISNTYNKTRNRYMFTSLLYH